MKKNYSKPEIVFESFKLTTSIASNCDYNSNSGDKNTCSVDVGWGPSVFVSKPICSVESENGNEFEVCYDVPTDDTRVFGS